MSKNIENIAVHDIQIDEGVAVNKKLLKQTRIFNIDEHDDHLDDLLAKYGL